MIYLIRLDKVLLWMLNLSHFRNLRVFNGLHWGGVEVVAAQRLRGIDDATLTFILFLKTLYTYSNVALYSTEPKDWDMEHDLKCHIISYYSAIAMRGGR